MELITKYFEQEKIEVNYSIENHKILISRHYKSKEGDEEIFVGHWDDREWFENHPLGDHDLHTMIKLKPQWESTKFIQEIINQILVDYQKIDKNSLKE